MATSPATAPVTQPRTVGLPRCTHSMSAQERPVTAAAEWVVTKALAASPDAPSALPALKPNHPNQRSEPPSRVMGTLWGGKLAWGWPRRRPTMIAATRAETPELMWTTVPPAKSRAPFFMSQPPPHTQCARGS